MVLMVENNKFIIFFINNITFLFFNLANRLRFFILLLNIIN